MKIRIKFRKYGEMKFIGHLDLMRYFQKALRRADIPVCYSGGFSPHMIMSFAQPLGVGITSDGEYLDIEVESALSSEDGVRRLNRVMAEGIEVLSFRQIPEEKSQNAMALVAAADYEVRFRPGKEPKAGWQQDFIRFLEKPEILILKKGKKAERELDIRPLIYEAQVGEDCIFLRLSAGSAANMKPELVMEAFYRFLFQAFDPLDLLLHRLELYAWGGQGDSPDGTDHGPYISLENLGVEFGAG